MTRPCFIHAGAHRTGSSSFQLCLWQNREVLARHGLVPVYPGRDGVPGGRLRLRLPRPRHGARRGPGFAAGIRAQLDTLAPPPARGIVLSEENIPGPMSHFSEGRFYPAAARRLAVLREALGEVPHILIVLRSYDALFASSYRKRAEDNPVRPFAELVPSYLAMDRGWVELLRDIRDVLRPHRLTVTDHDRRGPSTGLLRQLVPDLAEEALEEPEERVNLSATDAALVVLQRRYHAGEVLARAEWKQVLADHAQDRAPLGVAAFGPAAKAELRARYADDWARIRALDGITAI